MDFELSILNSSGHDRLEWLSLQKDLFIILQRDYSFLLNEEDCGHKLGDVLTEEDLESITTKLFEQNQGQTLNEIAVREVGFASTYHIALLLSSFMLVGNGECPCCGSNDIDDIPEHIDIEYNPATRLCRACQYEWSPVE